MPDVQFGKFRNRRNGRHILEGQAVTGMGLDAPLARLDRSDLQPLQFRRGRLGAAFDPELGIFSGVKFHDRGLKHFRHGDLDRIRLDEQRHPRASLV